MSSAVIGSLGFRVVILSFLTYTSGGGCCLFSHIILAYQILVLRRELERSILVHF